jgi:hypothetical protein
MSDSTDPRGGDAPAQSVAGDWRHKRRAGVLIGLAAAAVVALVVVVNLVHSNPSAAASAATASARTGMPVGASMSGMNMSGASGSMGMSTPSATATGSGTAKGGVAIIVGGKATASMPNMMPMTPLGSASWEGMLIKPVATAPLPFILFTQGTQQVIKPTAKTSFHLMVALDDAATGYAIPYASIWATITKKGKVVYDEALWPMISRYMGPHYGDNVSLPGAGTYKLTLLISPPEAARHIEYQGLWLARHDVSFLFHWEPAK